MILYFSGTGNSAYAARLLGEKINDTVVDMGKMLKDRMSYLFSEKPWVVVAPIYAWQMPRVVRDWLAKTTLSGSKEMYFVLTCGDSMGGAGKFAKELCDKKGMVYRGTAELKMPENYIIMFKAPDKEKTDLSVKLAEGKISKIAEEITAGKDITEKKAGAFDGIMSGIINNGFYKLFVSAKKFYAKDNCIGCGLCAKKCPLGNIKMAYGRPVWESETNCTQCMACICYCPVEAIEYGKATEGKVRYRCPKK